jgi:hypothetical protein
MPMSNPRPPAKALEDQLHLMLDIEALGLKPGAAITELAAQYFNPYTGTVGQTYNFLIKVQSPFHIDPETLAWHEEKGTYPRDEEEEAKAIPPALAVFTFDQFLKQHGRPDVFWSWGSTYDFPLLEELYQATLQTAPWLYWQAQCARTAYKTLLPFTPPTPKIHTAAADVTIQIKDLTAAFHVLRN